DEVAFTRKILWAHMTTGFAVIALLLFHELFGWFGAALGWYLFTLMAMMGFMNGLRWSQWLMAAMFAVITAAGIYFISRIFPGLEPSPTPIVPHSLLPIWLGFSNLIYGTICLLMLVSSRVWRAGRVCFTLW
ncbi:MAG: hypothetical protein ACKO8Z_11950, partial [Prosthecobacter sp.]